MIRFSWSSPRSRLVAYGLAATAAVAALHLLPALIVSPPGPPDLQWVSSRLYYQQIPAFLWPLAFVGLFLLTVVPLVLPRRLQAASFIVAASRMALLAALIIAVVFLVAIAIEPVI